METREYALAILQAETLDGKLAPPPVDLTDDAPGEAVRWPQPARPPRLAFTAARSKMPGPGALVDPRRRASALHRFANHELQALEIMAWALLAFPDAPAAFRRGLVRILHEEQQHMALYIARMEALGLRFGDEPVNDYFWRKIEGIHTVLDYVAAMALTFEAANLDFALDFAESFRRVGDTASAEVVARVHEDEIGHVRFGIIWLRKLKPEGDSDWDTFTAHLHHPLHPARARGRRLDREARLKAGFDEGFLDRLDAITPAMVAESFGRPTPKGP